MRNALPLPRHQEIGPMLFTDCPLCDQPASVDESSGVVECPACAVRLEIAEEREVMTLAAAA